MKTWHKLGLIVSGLLAITSWVIALYFWPQLPNTIPTHFGFNGLPDAWNQKLIWYVFLIPTIHSIIAGLFIFLYEKPQYSDMPTTLWLTTLNQKQKNHAFALIRTMLVGTSLWIGLLLTYLTLAMNLSAFPELMIAVSPLIIFLLVAGMIIWLVWWTIKVYRETKVLIKKGN